VGNEKKVGTMKKKIMLVFGTGALLLEKETLK